MPKLEMISPAPRTDSTLVHTGPSIVIPTTASPTLHVVSGIPSSMHVTVPPGHKLEGPAVQVNIQPPATPQGSSTVMTILQFSSPSNTQVTWTQPNFPVVSTAPISPDSMDYHPPEPIPSNFMANAAAKTVTNSNQTPSVVHESAQVPTPEAVVTPTPKRGRPQRKRKKAEETPVEEPSAAVTEVVEKIQVQPLPKSTDTSAITLSDVPLVPIDNGTLPPILTATEIEAKTTVYDFEDDEVRL